MEEEDILNDPFRQWNEEEKTRALLVKRLLDKSNPGTEAKWIVSQASILLEYIKPK